MSTPIPENIATLTITDLTQEGAGLGRLPSGEVIIVAKTLIGDEVQVKLAPKKTQKKSKIRTGNLLKFLTPSPLRLSSVCQNTSCTLCSLKNLNMAAQKNFKLTRIQQTLKRLSHLENIPIQELPDTPNWHYRHRVRLHAHFVENSWQFGYYLRESHQLLPFKDCPILLKELAEITYLTTQALDPLPKELQIKSLELAYSAEAKAAAGCLILSKEGYTYLEKNLSLETSFKTVSVKTGLKGLIIKNQDNFKKQLHYGEPRLWYKSCPLELALFYEPGVFTQTNLLGNAVLSQTIYDEVLKAEFHPCNILELHGGILNFSLPLSQLATKIDSIELNPESHALAQYNLEKHGLATKIQLHQTNDHEFLETCLKAPNFNYQILLLDPPRRGLKELSALLAQSPNRFMKIIYISCDIATLARDLAILVKAPNRPYQLQKLYYADLFKQTLHLETVAILQQSP